VVPKPTLEFFVRVEYTKITLHTKFEVPIQSASGPKELSENGKFSCHNMNQVCYTGTE